MPQHRSADKVQSALAEAHAPTSSDAQLRRQPHIQLQMSLSWTDIHDVAQNVDTGRGNPTIEKLEARRDPKGPSQRSSIGKSGAADCF